MVDRCEVCDRWIKFKDDHDWPLHATKTIAIIDEAYDKILPKIQPPKKRAVLVPMNYIRMNDDLLETTSAFLEEDGNVIISGAWFKTLMDEAGWKARK